MHTCIDLFAGPADLVRAFHEPDLNLQYQLKRSLWSVKPFGIANCIKNWCSPRTSVLHFNWNRRDGIYRL